VAEPPLAWNVPATVPLRCLFLGVMFRYDTLQARSFIIDSKHQQERNGDRKPDANKDATSKVYCLLGRPTRILRILYPLACTYGTYTISSLCLAGLFILAEAIHPASNVQHATQTIRHHNASIPTLTFPQNQTVIRRFSKLLSVQMECI
jgi:hypothetical protein